MSSSVTNQTWILIDAASQKQRSNTPKQGEERVAQANSSSATVADLQQFEKDVLIPASAYKGMGMLAARSPSGAPSKPQLPYPRFSWNGFQGTDANQPGLISIIGTVMALQAKTNSNFWSSLWKQASQSMMMEVKFAPIIGDAIRSQYEAEAAATRSQAEQAKQEGIASIMAFSGGVLMAGYMEYNDEASPGKSGDEVEQENETKQPGSSQTNQTQTSKTDADIDKMINKQEETWQERAKRVGGKIKSGLTKGQKRFSSLIGKALQTTTMANMLSDGITKVGITSKYQAQQAMYQAEQGACQALSQEAQQYSQFYGQDFSREEDLRQGVSQNIDYAMNILKSAADSITQTITSLFRG